MKDHIAYKYKISTLPHSFLIDKKGVVVKQFVGYKKDSLIEKELNKLFNEPIKNLKVN
jgi:glutathione peroxidase-family protein